MSIIAMILAAVVVLLVLAIFQAPGFFLLLIVLLAFYVADRIERYKKRLRGSRNHDDFIDLDQDKGAH